MRRKSKLSMKLLSGMVILSIISMLLAFIMAQIAGIARYSTGDLIFIISIAPVISTVFVYFFISREFIKPLERLSEFAEEIAAGNISIDLPKPLQDRENNNTDNADEILQVFISFSEIAKTLDNFHNEYEKMQKNLWQGKTHYRMETSRFKGIFKECLEKANAIIFDFESTLSLINQPYILINRDMRVMHANRTARQLNGINHARWNEIVGTHIDDFLRTNISQNPATVQAFREKTPQVDVDVCIEFQPGKILNFVYNCIPYDYEGGYFGAILLLTDISQVRDIEKYTEKLNLYRMERTEKLTDIITHAFQKGNLNIDIPYSDYDQDTIRIAKEQDEIENIIQESTNIIKGYVDEITAILHEIANNNFDMRINREFIGDFGSIKHSIKMIVESVGRLIGEIQNVTIGIEGGSEVIAQSTQELMANFENQALAISEVSGSVNNLTQKTKKNARDLHMASKSAKEIQEAAEIGIQHMLQMSATMEEIKESSTEIAKIASIIDSIAFQTNLLALNASIEAVQAGEHGRGFSVVAEEVRSLAGLSASASKDASEKIKESIDRAAEGVVNSQKTAHALHKIVEMTSIAATVIHDIADASDEQAKEIIKIHNNMELVNKSAAENSAAVQSNASVSEELSSQAMSLRSLVEQFKISKK